MPIDRSTAAAARAAPLSEHARRFVLVSVSLLLAACSSLKLGYNNADTLLAYTLDSYLRLDGAQQQLARARIEALHRWHRDTQLGDYVLLLNDAQAKVAGPVTAAEVRQFNAGVNRLLAAIGDRAAADLAELAATLRPEQVERLAGRLERDTSKARRELVRFAGAESLEQRVDAAVERAENWLGRLTPAQRELIRERLSRRPQAQEFWLQERERRQRELVALVARIGEAQPAPEVAAAWFREYFAQLDEPREPQRRAELARLRQDNAELIADLLDSATPAQRAALARKLRGYAADLEALAQGAAGRG
jgi:hypothetical protein